MMHSTSSLDAPMSQGQSPRELGSAAMRWCCSRRGRWFVCMMVMFGVFLTLTAMKNREVLSLEYRTLSAQYSWRPYLPNLPLIVHSPFKTPSNTTLEIESGMVNHVPPKLKKTTPNFHLLLPSERETHGFCKTTLSAMLLDYPPPTTINLMDDLQSDTQWELNTLNSTLNYLSDARLVRDEDLVLIVDGQQSWFQLPSDVLITQYKRLLEDANWRLLTRYGFNADGYQKFNQTIVFGAEKMCVGDDMACRYVPHSILPGTMYGEEHGEEHSHRIADMPATFVNSKMVMGPAKDLRLLYEAALTKFMTGRTQSQTVQSVFATILGEQQLRREAVDPKPTSWKLKEFFLGSKKVLSSQQAAAKLHDGTQHEFSIGLDYLHILFQPLLYCTEDELVAVRHDNSTDLSIHRHPGSVYQRLSLPAALDGMHPPFWRPDLFKNNPSPNEKAAYVNPLEFDEDLDRLPSRKTSWRRVRLVQNTYTGAVPAILLDNNPLHSGAERPPAANITWEDLWFSPYKRALLRNYFRTPQSPTGYHNSLVGGDRAWDMRGGRGGVWKASTATWSPWGEADGVCGTLSQLKEVFDDDRGVWMHEKEVTNEEDRLQREKEVAENTRMREEKWQKHLQEEQEEVMRKEDAELKKNDSLEAELKQLQAGSDQDRHAEDEFRTEDEIEEPKDLAKAEEKYEADEDDIKTTKASEDYLSSLSDEEREEAERQRHAAEESVARHRSEEERQKKKAETDKESQEKTEKKAEIEKGEDRDENKTFTEDEQEELVEMEEKSNTHEPDEEKQTQTGKKVTRRWVS